MSEFPILERKINGHRLVYLDSASTSQKPQVVIDAISNHYQEHNANIHRAIYTLAEESTSSYDEARGKVASFVNAPAKNIIFTKGTTESINFVAFTWGLSNLKEGDEILISGMEHHANIVPWQHVAKMTKAKIVPIELQEDFTLDVKDLKSKITSKTRLLAITHVSNVTGVVNPLREIIDLAHENNIVVCVDGAQAVPHMVVDLQNLQPDFYAFSSHKMCGPTGIGALYIADQHYDLPPYQYGGDMINDVWDDRSEFASNEPRRFEAGTQNIAGAIGFAAATQFLKEKGMQSLLSHERELLQYAWDELAILPGLTLYGPPPGEQRIGVVSFNLEGVHPHDVAQILDEKGIAIRSGQHCAHPLLRRMKVTATNRVSFYLYNTKEDVDVLVEGLKYVQEVFK